MTREEAIKWLKAFKGNTGMIELSQAFDVAIKALEQEPCRDAISRQEAIDAISKDVMGGLNYLGILTRLPPVTPEQMAGHWIYTDYHTWCCSECCGNPHKGTGFVPNKDGMKMRWRYCNLCGAKMEVDG